MAESVPKSLQFLDCVHEKEPVLIRPSSPTPKHSLTLSNLDDQLFLRFSIKYLYVFKTSVNLDLLKSALSSVLVDYYPLAGRLRRASPDNDDDDDDDQTNQNKLKVDCNGEGALFVEAFLDMDSDQFLQLSWKPNRSCRSLLYKNESLSFIHTPPLVVQVTNLRCGGMILCTAINHCLCDGVGASQFLHAWAHATSQSSLTGPPVPPFHSRHVLKYQNPTQIHCTHPQYTKTPRDNWHVDITKSLQSQPLMTSSLIFTSSQLLRLKNLCAPILNCTTFETLASHTWRSWIRSLDLPPSLHVKLLFPVNIRKKTNPQIPQGYYGNGFVLGCAEASVNELTVVHGLNGVVELVQNAKATIDDNYVKSMIDLLGDKCMQADLSSSLVISEWSKLGLEDIDFGVGKPLHMGPLTSEVFCLILPVIGDIKAVRVLVSVPESVIEKFEYYMTREYFSDYAIKV